MYWIHQLQRNHVLQITSGIETMGHLRLELLGCLALAWVVVFLCLIKGIKSSGKIVYVTATFPYIILMIFLVYGCTLPGAVNGILYYVIPKWEKLLNFKIWGQAAMQMFFSCGVGGGSIITLASYNKFHNNCFRDSLIIGVTNSLTSILAGFVVFAIIGFMAHEAGSGVEDVVTSGPGLVFIAYPAAMARMPVPSIWAVMFFVMIISLGLDTQFAMIENIVSALVDEFPKYLKNRRRLFMGLLCFVAFCLGIPCIMQGGVYYLQIMDWYSGTLPPMLICVSECVAIAWVYGHNKFSMNIEQMIGNRPSLWFKICWCGLTPAIIVFVFVYGIISYEHVTYGSYTYPSWAIGLGWMFAACSMIPLPLIAVIQILQSQGPLIQRIKNLSQPSASWGPTTKNTANGVYKPCLSDEPPAVSQM